MTGFSEMPGQDPRPGNNPENLQGFDAEPLPAPHGAGDPGRTLGIVGFVLSFFTTIIGLILSIVAYNMSRKAGFSNGFAVAGIVIGAITTLLGGVFAVLALSIGLAGLGMAGS